MAVRDRIEAGFERWGHFVSRRAYVTIAVMVLLTLGLASQLPSLTMDVSSESFLHKDDPVRLTYDAYLAQFGRHSPLVVAIEPSEVFDLRFLDKLRAFHADLEREVPQVEKVTSLINARHIHGEDGEFIVEDLLEDWPQSGADLAELKDLVLSNPLYRNFLISEDGRVTAVMIELDTYSSLDAGVGDSSAFEDTENFGDGDGTGRRFLTGEERFANVGAARDVISRYDSPDFKLHLAGGPVMEATLMTAMQRDIVRFVALSVLVIGLVLFVLFRRVSGVILPLLLVGLSVLSTMGTMAMMGVAVTLPIQVLPSFLLAVGVSDSVHILAIFFRTLRNGNCREEAIAHSLGHSGLAVVMTSLTTAGGLVSFASADLRPVMHFGIFGPIGVIFALLFTIVLLPALLAVTPLRKEPDHDGQSVLLDRVLIGFGTAAARRPWAVLLATTAFLILGVAGALRLRFSHDPLSWLPKTDPCRVDTEFVDRELHGSLSLQALLDTGIENGFHNPKLLRQLDELRVYSESFRHGGRFSVGKTFSVADILKETNQALNGNRSQHYTIPQDRRLVAQEFLLLENSGSDDLEDLVDFRFSTASFVLMVPYGDAVDGMPFIDEIEAHFRDVLGEDVQVTMTGRMVLMGRTETAAIFSMAKSYAIAFLLVTPLMILLLGSFRGGLVSMIPNLVPIILTLGLMGWLDFPLDFSTMMIGAIILGLAVDDTIHFMHNFHRDYRASGDAKEAVEHTLQTTGRAMLFTSIVLSMGFFIFMFATMGNLFNLGVFAGFAIVVAFLADVLLSPALLVLFRRQIWPTVTHARTDGPFSLSRVSRMSEAGSATTPSQAVH